MRSVAEPSSDVGGDVLFSRALMDQIREGVVRFEQDLGIRSGNRSWLTMVGLEQGQARGRNLEELLDAEDLVRLRAGLTELTSTWSQSGGGRDAAPLKSPELRLTWKAADGRAIDSLTVLFAGLEPGHDGGEDRWVFSGLVHDLTVENLAAEERRRLRERLSRTQKNESLGILAGGLAHDFNNVLTAILGLVDVAQLQLPEDSQVRPIIQDIAKTADYAAILVRNLLSYSRRGKGVSSSVDLAGLTQDLVQWAVSSLRPSAEIELSCAAGLPPALGDSDQIRQAVTNLILNATEALKPSGPSQGKGKGKVRLPRIRIETGMVQIDDLDLQRAVFVDKPKAGEYLFIEVWDNGCGIEPAVAPRIFDPFFTTKPTGRGLGLAAVQGIVCGHGGFLKVDSEPGRGTAVRLHFPMSSSRADGPSKAPEAQRPEPKMPPKGNILVVDDEEAVRGIAETTLTMAGYDVTLAEDGLAGWELVRGRPDDFVGILLDITMPRMTGDEMLARVREIRPELPVLLSSGFSSNEACFSTTDDPHTRFLKKPYRTRELKQHIAELIAGAG